MKWYEEGEGHFENGVFVVSDYDKKVQEWGKKIAADPNAVVEFFDVCENEQMFDDVMNLQRITPAIMHKLLEKVKAV